jgi:hypothetical protein
MSIRFLVFQIDTGVVVRSGNASSLEAAMLQAPTADLGVATTSIDTGRIKEASVRIDVAASTAVDATTSEVLFPVTLDGQAR